MNVKKNFYALLLVTALSVITSQAAVELADNQPYVLGKPDCKSLDNDIKSKEKQLEQLSKNPKKNDAKINKLKNEKSNQEQLYRERCKKY